MKCAVRSVVVCALLLAACTPLPAQLFSPPVALPATTPVDEDSQFTPAPYPSTTYPAALLPLQRAPVAVAPDPYADLAIDAPISPYSAVVGPSELSEYSDPESVAVGPADGQFELSELEPDEEHRWYQPLYWFGPTPWDTGIELGLNGTSGTRESLSIRTGGYLKRESRYARFSMDASYNKTTANGIDTQNNAELDLRNDWLLADDSPWTLFSTGTVFYDEFQAFDLQLNANMGVGYRFVNEPWMSLIGRIGSGTSTEINGPSDKWASEGAFGLDYEQCLTPAQKFYGKLEYFPEWDAFEHYRLVADIGWEIELVRPSNMSLKISATDRYDSTPNGADPEILNYSVLLLWKL